MTQKELATEAQITLSYISRLEAGGAAPGIDLLERLANALNANVTELLPAPEAGLDKGDVKKLFEAVTQKAGPEILDAEGVVDSAFGKSRLKLLTGASLAVRLSASVLAHETAAVPRTSRTAARVFGMGR